MKGDGPTGRGVGEQALLQDIDPGPDDQSLDCANPNLWVERLRDALAKRSPDTRGVAEQAVRACPTDPELLLLAALAAVAASQPERALALLKRYQKRFAPGRPITLLTALALAQQRLQPRLDDAGGRGVGILSGRCPLVRGRRCDAGLAA